jgi:AcrR family transcriptional regulator
VETNATDSQAVRRGRPRKAEVPAKILDAAARLFSENGYSGTSVRQVAAAAGTDPAIVMRHFESKERLFLQTMVVDYGSRNFVDGPLDTLGRNLLRRLFEDIDPTVPSMFRALSHAADRPEVRAYLEETAMRHIIGPLVERLPGTDAELRGRLVGTVINGMLATFWVAEDPFLLSQPLPHVLDVYAEALQALIDGAS